MIKELNKIKQKPKIADGKHYLFNADCLEILRQIPDKSIKLIITDPPYNIGLKYNKYKDKKKDLKRWLVFLLTMEVYI